MLEPSKTTPRVVKSTSDQTHNSATPTDASGLAFKVNAGRYYYFRFVVIYRSDTSTTGLRFGCTTPTYSVYAATAKTISNTSDGGAAEAQGLLNTSGDTFTGANVYVINEDQHGSVEGVIVPTADGTLQLQFGTETGTTVVTLRKGSCGFLWDLGT